MKTAYQSLLEEWAGTENLVYLTFDAPEQLGCTLAAIQEKNDRTVRLTAETEADGAIFWEDSSTTNLSPGLYDRYIRPEITCWAAVFREHGKFLVQHACGYIKDLIPLMTAQGIQAIESLTPEPTGNLPLDQIWDGIPEEVAVIGGIDPTILLNATLEELQHHAQRLLDVSQKRRFILANSDSCPPHVEYEKFLMLSRLVKEQS